MATRRKQKVRHYKQGGAVPLDDVLPGFGREDAAALPADVTAAPALPEPDNIPPSETGDAVLQAILRQRRAEELQTQRAAEPAPHQQPAPPQPQMSPRRRAFVEANPELANPQNAEAVMGYLRQAERMGMQDEAEVDAFVLQSLKSEQRQREPRREEPASYAEPPQARAEPRRSMPMSAPVQRSAPTMSGKPRTSGTLTAEEREMAHAAIPDRPDLPKLTNAQKEFMYLQNREKYQRMKADGTYSEQRQR
jgi:hypothetical protein